MSSSAASLQSLLLGDKASSSEMLTGEETALEQFVQACKQQLAFDFGASEAVKVMCILWCQRCLGIKFKVVLGAL